MKITIEVDRNIIKNGEPDIQIVTIEEEAVDLEEHLDLFKRVLLALGFCFSGDLTIEEEENEVSND
jgi:hypothetical protein